MENLNAEEIKCGLEQFHRRILNTKLAEKITESEIMAIIDALAFINSQEQRIKELTEDIERVTKQCGEIIVECDERDAERLKQVAELTKENERLRAERDTFEIYYKDYKYKNKELTAFNRRWAKECAELQEECEYIKADTVRKMQERLKVCFDNEIEHMSIYTEGQVLFVIDQIAKEMLE